MGIRQKVQSTSRDKLHKNFDEPIFTDGTQVFDNILVNKVRMKRNFFV